MKLKLLGKASSINVRKVLWTLEELGLAYDREDWGSGFAATDTPEFTRLNPNAMVPVLIDGDFVLWESNSICRYLAAREQRLDLLPQAPQARAQVEQWMDWQAGEFNNAWRYAFMSLVRHSPAHQDPQLLAQGVAAWHRHVRILDAQLARTGAFVCGEQFTLADVVLGLSLQRWRVAPLEDEGRPDVPAARAYMARLEQRAGFREHGANGHP